MQSLLRIPRTESAEVAKIGEAAEIAETEIVRLLKTVKTWVFLKKWKSSAEKNFFLQICRRWQYCRGMRIE